MNVVCPVVRSVADKLALFKTEIKHTMAWGMCIDMRCVVVGVWKLPLINRDKLAEMFFKFGNGHVGAPSHLDSPVRLVTQGSAMVDGGMMRSNSCLPGFLP